MNTTISEFIAISSNGTQIIETNFWETDLNAKGKFYLSGNAGAFRLLVPSGYEKVISEMLTAKEVVITKGWHKQMFRDMVEVMFDDHSEAPFALWISIAQTDNRVADKTQEDFELLVYTQGCLVAAKFKAYWRRGKLPCLKPYHN